MGPVGVWEMIFIFVLALLILGPRKLPELGRQIGKGLSEFRRASHELRSTFEREMNTLERENESLRDVGRSVSAAINPASDYTYDDYSYSSSNDSTTSDSAPQAAEAQPAATTAEAPAGDGAVPNEAKSEVKA